MTAKFMPVADRHSRRRRTSRSQPASSDGARVITTGAGALKDGDRIVAANAQRGGGRRRRTGQRQ